MVFCKLQVVFFKGVGEIEAFRHPCYFSKLLDKFSIRKKIFDELCNPRNCLGNVDMNF